MRKTLLLLVLTPLITVAGSAQAQTVQPLTQRAPVSLTSVSINPNGVQAEVGVTLTNAGENPVVAVALGVVMVDAFNDTIAVHYVRWTDDLSTLAPGASTELTGSVTEARADEIVLGIPFVYAVRFENGEVWKENLSDVATELLGRFSVAASPTTLQP